MNKVLTSALVTLAVAALAGACNRESGSAPQTADAATEIPIGLYAALTGPTASFGTATRDGVLFAAEQINASGGLLGKKVRVITEDDQGKPEVSASVVSKLVTQNNVVAVIGQNSSSNSLAAAPIAQSNKIPMVSPSSTNPDVTKKGDYIFRVCFTDPLQGKALARFTVEYLKLNRVAILQDIKSDYSVGLAKVYSEALTSAGGTVVVNQSYAEGDNDFRSQLTAVRDAKPQALFIPGYYTDAAQIALQARDLGVTVPLIGGDGWESPKLLEIGGKAMEGSYYAATVSLATPDAATQKFVADFKQRFGRDPEGLNALGYDAMNVIAQAIRTAGKTDGPAIRDAIAKTQNFAGAAGEITFGPDRDPLKPVPIVVVKNGRTEFLQSVKP